MLCCISYLLNITLGDRLHHGHLELAVVVDRAAGRSARALGGDGRSDALGSGAGKGGSREGQERKSVLHGGLCRKLFPGLREMRVIELVGFVYYFLSMCSERRSQRE